jgi:hypothetical protein
VVRSVVAVGAGRAGAHAVVTATAGVKAVQLAVRFELCIGEEGADDGAVAQFGMEDQPRAAIDAQAGLVGTQLFR